MIYIIYSIYIVKVNCRFETEEQLPRFLRQLYDIIKFLIDSKICFFIPVSFWLISRRLKGLAYLYSSNTFPSHSTHR